MILSFLFSVFAHPFSTDEYSLRTSVKVSEQGVSMLIAMEVPIPIALKEIGAKKEESKKAKQKKIDTYTKKQWKLLGDSMTYTVDGKEQKGKWFPINDPANGKAAEGFFVYLISFQPKKQPVLQSGSTIEISTTAYTEKKMVYSASVYDSPAWSIKNSTAHEILGENQFIDITSPQRWSREEPLRSIKIEIEKATSSP